MSGGLYEVDMLTFTGICFVILKKLFAMWYIKTLLKSWFNISVYRKLIQICVYARIIYRRIVNKFRTTIFQWDLI